jgi:hypothetical protein
MSQINAPVSVTRRGTIDPNPLRAPRRIANARPSEEPRVAEYRVDDDSLDEFCAVDSGVDSLLPGSSGGKGAQDKGQRDLDGNPMDKDRLGQASSIQQG